MIYVFVFVLITIFLILILYKEALKQRTKEIDLINTHFTKKD